MYKNIALIFISFFFLISSITEFGNMFLSIPSFLILSYNLSDLSLKIVNKKETKYKKSKNFELISLVGVIPTLFVIRDFEQTLGGYILFWKLAFFSLIFVSVTIFFLFSSSSSHCFLSRSCLSSLSFLSRSCISSLSFLSRSWFILY